VFALRHTAGVSGEASLSAENSEEKTLGGGGSTLNPAWGAHSAIPDPLAGAMGLLPLRLALASALQSCPPPSEKSWAFPRLTHTEGRYALYTLLIIDRKSLGDQELSKLFAVIS